MAKFNDTDSEHEHPVEDDNNDTLTFMMGLSQGVTTLTKAVWAVL